MLSSHLCSNRERPSLLLLILIFDTIFACCIAHQQSSSLHIDNDMRAAIEASFLRKLGLSHRPKPKSRVTVPDHLLQLYDMIMRAHHPHYQSEADLIAPPEFDYQPIGHFDSARSFYPDSDTNAETSVTYSFSLDGLPSNDILENAELRFSLSNTDEAPMGLLRVSVHEVVRDHVVLIDSVLIDCAAHPHSINLDVTTAVHRWRTRTSLQPAGALLLQQSQPVGSNATCGIHLASHPITKQSPYLIVYMSEKTPPSHRRKRAVDLSTKPGAKHKRRHQHTGHQVTYGRQDLCSKRDLYVDFERIGWNDWIVAPHGFEAHYCSGTCGTPLPQSMNASNHAIVQSIVSSVTHGAIPNACCTPERLAPISMLYIDSYDKVVLKTYEEMVVESCGCR